MCIVILQYLFHYLSSDVYNYVVAYEKIDHFTQKLVSVFAAHVKVHFLYKLYSLLQLKLCLTSCFYYVVAQV